MNSLPATTIDTRTTLTTSEHECAYANRVAFFKHHSGSLAVNSTVHLDAMVTSLHHDNICPPTHIGGNPTSQWEDIIEHTRIS